MKVIIVKDHHHYPLGEVEVDEDRARYLISCGIAVEPVEPEPEPDDSKSIGQVAEEQLDEIPLLQDHLEKQLEIAKQDKKKAAPKKAAPKKAH